jgi:hypothetical protein
MSVWRQTGVRPKELEDMIEFPQTVAHVWKFFIDLHNTRSSNGFGVNPISYSDIYSYFKLLEIQPYDWEIETITKLDKVALEAFAEQAKKEQKKNKG